jgi:hypothetical protein
MLAVVPMSSCPRELLRRSDVTRREIELGARRVSGSVHPHPTGLPGWNHASSLEAAVPPSMEGGRAQRLKAILPHNRDVGLVLPRDLPLLPARGLHLGEQEVLHGIAAEDKQLELLSELFGGERHIPHLAAFRPHAHAATAEIEVLEAELGERSLADNDQEQELQGDPVAQLGLGGDDPFDDLSVEERSFDVAEPRRPNRTTGSPGA